MADTVIMPKLGFDMAEGTLVRWVVAEGETITKGSVLAEIETDKATVEVESTFSGTVLHHLVPQGTIVPVNTPIAVIGEPGEQVDIPEQAVGTTQSTPPVLERVDEKPAAPESVPPPSPTGEEKIVRASPLARRIAGEKKIDLRQIRGSGPGGRIVRKDIEAYLSKAKEAAAGIMEAPISAQATDRVSTAQDRQIPLTRLRSAIARRMTEAVQQVPHFFVTHNYDMAAVMDLRKQINALLSEEEKISVNDFIVKAVALALAEFPNLNASIDLSKELILQHGAINVGVAVALESGLLTVVCRNANQKSLRQIALEVRGMVERARQGKVRPDDIEGSTFTVSNLGMFDVEQFTAIINPPEAAILAVGSVQQVPVVVNGEVRVGTRMRATLSVDHRVSDGAEGAKFMQALETYLATPLRLLL